MSRILLIEDEQNIAKGIILNLELEGYEVVHANRGDLGIKLYKDQEFDLVVLDLMLPVISGEDILVQIREINEKTPVLVLSAKDSSKSKVRCFNLGTDDYLSKPFNLDEFILRVKRLLKRSSWTKKEVTIYKFGANEIHFSDFKALCQGEEYTLTEQEVKILTLLTQNEGEVVTRGELLELLGYKKDSNTRTIDNFIVRFRKYFEENPKEPKHIISIRSVGYKFIK
ncbi:response regulator transcription factor [Halobacteriovorax sp. XZX-3]|uniref:response regulator transcription factor n=1 Tax=unclassified Halobacteriovorax TaxID=2639665 RepID=UPI00371E2F54